MIDMMHDAGFLGLAPRLQIVGIDAIPVLVGEPRWDSLSQCHRPLIGVGDDFSRIALRPLSVSVAVIFARLALSVCRREPKLTASATGRMTTGNVADTDVSLGPAVAEEAPDSLLEPINCNELESR